MDNSILVSVIIPAYNAEKYLDRAVRSVLCQMDGSIELILVNDGSTDRTGAMCDGYAENCPNVRVVHKQNGGISSARNAGMAVATGEYLMFLDADDFFEPNVFREVSKVIIADRPDMIDFGWQYVTGDAIMPPAFHKLPKNVLLGEQELKELILPPLLNLYENRECFIFDFAWNKVYRADIIRDNQACFDENRRIWEDRPFAVQYLHYCKNYYAMNQCFYNYVATPGSLSSKYTTEYFRIIIENFRLYKDLYGQEYDFDTEYVNSYWCHSIESKISFSLEQKENCEQIRQTVINVLQNEQVVHWFKNRTPKDLFESEVSALVVGGQNEKALQLYEKAVKRNQRKQTVKNICLRIKTLLRRVIRG